MKVKIDLKMEILEGEDKGYILEESNRIINLERSRGGINPYRVILDFVTPGIMREWRELERESKKWEIEQENYKRGEEVNQDEN